MAKKAIRILKNVSKQESCSPFFKELQIMTLPSLYIYCSLLDVKENLNSFINRQDVHTHCTRKKYLLDLPPVRLEKTKNSQIFFSIKLFNKLPEKAWNVTLNNFKVTIAKWLKNKAFYTVEDYLACDISSLSF
ncbi:hypothetical protein J6590_108341 [Homalodisca vitripennis]|nr:hypothetical protein J6590_108466 [Homalodisca vitripennis]KAG8309681.1 hypothetical protein J6590_108341 [Homalodisca vitripennis]